MLIKKYTDNNKKEWDAFLSKAKNTHFFFKRDYMEYHKDRFYDFSLMVFNDKGDIVALLPASLDGDIVISHGGLTFGGFVVGDKMTTELMLEIFTLVREFLKGHNITKLVYKCIPYIYYNYPTEEDKYALFINNANLIRRDVSTTIYLPERYKYQERRRRMINKARKNNIAVKKSNDYKAYIELLNNVLHKRHDTIAVHNAKEITLLAELFPENIRLYIAEHDDELLAGTVLFINGNVVHTQYMANSDKGRELGALDCVLDYLITTEYASYKYFDFGISNENQGRYLNRGLIGQKEGFGARAVVHDFYEIDI